MRQPTQKQMWEEADRRIRGLFRTFAEIQRSDNPLTKAEVEALARKRPERYGILAPWVKP